MDKAKQRETSWTDIQRRQSAGKALFLGDTKWLFAEVVLLREELFYLKACSEQNNRETNEQREKVKRLRAALAAAENVLARIALEPAFVAECCPGVQRIRYVVGSDVKDTALEGAQHAKAALAEAVRP
ncbi:MAG: hypothetical protein A2075_09140 [Geobacteraceae bacterium GWC2_58_44]|nr:MAG: hypothetical protein A2075_09140 [Geobacteraceae bacterium GWC2_58_44]HBG07678.1 hypothetical protein [Geobacter sp.]